MRGWRWFASVVCLGCLGLLGATGVGAQTATFAPLGAEPNYTEMALQWVRQATPATLPPSSTPLRLEISVGSMDNRFKLAPCNRAEAYLPPGSRLWGKTRVGVRCVDGSSKWNITLPASIKAFGSAWVVRGLVSPGAALSETDAVETEVDWAEEPNPVLREPSQWSGQLATRALTTGMVLRQGMVKPAWAFQAGAPVRVVAQGPGFEVSSDAQAISAGIVGQSARVRMENGRITTGIVLDARTVKIDL